MQSSKNLYRYLSLLVVAVMIVAGVSFTLATRSGSPATQASIKPAEAQAVVASGEKPDGNSSLSSESFVYQEGEAGYKSEFEREHSQKLDPSLQYGPERVERFPSGIEVHHSLRNDVSPRLDSIKPVVTSSKGEADDDGELAFEAKFNLRGNDTVVQRSAGPNAVPTPIISFNGINISGGCGGCQPPDTNGEVGPNHYMQSVNTSFQIWNKSGVSLYGPANVNTVFAGFGGACQTRNDGDPVVLYDQLADRWLISQFTAASPYYECVAVSSTSDPLGAYNRYAFQLSATEFPDYPKLSMWPDAYYMTTVAFAGGQTYVGPRPFAFDRVAMLNNQPATFQTTAAGLGAQYRRALPVDLEGPIAPAAGTPGYIIGLDSPIPLWKFQVDFVTPANTTFTALPSAANAAFSDLCVGNRSCVPQPGTTNRIDVLGNRPMFRAPFRPNIGGNGGSLLMMHTVDVGGAQAGERWYEIRGLTTNNPTVFQQGTYAPDNIFRFMGSMAMDASGDIAMGYSAGNASLFPSIRYTGRLASDPLGQMQAEASLYEGTAAQTSGQRWGDYSDMSVDPVDDCTFWYTQEYSNGGGSWATRIGSFRFPECVSGGGSPTPTVTGTPPTATRTATAAPSATRTNTALPSSTPNPCANYTFSTTTGNTIVPGTGLIPGTNGDDLVANTTLPFPVRLYGSNFTSVNVSTNGNLQFSSVDTTFTNVDYPVASQNNVIHPHWDDFNLVGTGDGVYTTTTGTAPDRVLYFEWRGVFFGTTTRVNLNAVFYENNLNRIDFIYGANMTGASATIGLQEGTGSRFARFSFNTASVSPGTRVIAQQGCTTVTPAATSTVAATVAPSATSTAQATATSILPTVTLPPLMTVTPQTTGTAVLPTVTVSATVQATGTAQATSTAAASPTTCPTINFTDVPTSNIFYSDIQFLACRGIINGFPNGDGTFRFEPNGNAKRGEFAKIAVRAFNIPAFTPATPTFNDVPANYIFYSFIEAAANSGAIQGLSANQCAALGTPGRCFGPNLLVTRAQVAVIVQRARNFVPTTPATPTFVDVPTNSFAYVAVETLAARSIITGAACPAPQSGQCFRPNDNIRRGELSRVTRRAMEAVIQ